jgi:hypothetical protein
MVDEAESPLDAPEAHDTESLLPVYPGMHLSGQLVS